MINFNFYGKHHCFSTHASWQLYSTGSGMVRVSIHRPINLFTESGSLGGHVEKDSKMAHGVNVQDHYN